MEVLKVAKEWHSYFQYCFGSLHTIELIIKRLVNIEYEKTHELYSLYKRINYRYRRWISIVLPEIEDVIRIAQEKGIYYSSRGYSRNGGISYTPEVKEFCDKYMNLLNEFANFAFNVLSKAISENRGEKIIIVYYIYKKLQEEYPSDRYPDLEIKLDGDFQKLHIVSRNELLLSTVRTTIKRLLTAVKRYLRYSGYFPVKETENGLLLEAPQ